MKKIVAGLLSVLLLLGAVPTAMAQDPAGDAQPATEVVVAAGITPDSLFYGFDRAVEQIGLFLAQGQAYKAEFLSKLAAERLAEAEEMVSVEKQNLAQEMVDEFVAILKAITENLEAAALQAGTTEDDEGLSEALRSVRALRGGFRQRVNELLELMDEDPLEDPNAAIDENEDVADAIEELTEGEAEQDTAEDEEADEAEDDEEGETDEQDDDEEATEDEEGAAESDDEDSDEEDDQSKDEVALNAIQAAIIKVYGLDEDIFEQMAAAGLNPGQSKMLAILIGRANQRQGEDDEPVLTLEEALSVYRQGWGQLKKKYGLKAGELGLAIGHILKQARNWDEQHETCPSEDEEQRRERRAEQEREREERRAELEREREKHQAKAEREKEKHQEKQRKELAKRLAAKVKGWGKAFSKKK
ncbi:MAG: DUF5667 domain-containing protein [Bacillota bacterium]|jgi:hypothetical protein